MYQNSYTHVDGQVICKHEKHNPHYHEDDAPKVPTLSFAKKQVETNWKKKNS